ncbi:MAG TPA: hypothetical protein VGV92_01545 [Gammaproteobacteria bacterium]|nr:hypothetical protein [Gammaproteobacteria bacterium]
MLDNLGGSIASVNQTNTTVNGINGAAVNRDTMGTAAHNIGRGLSKAVSKGASKVKHHVTGPSKAVSDAQRGRSIHKKALDEGLSNTHLKDPAAIIKLINQHLGALLELLAGNPEDIAEAKRKCYDTLARKCGSNTKKLELIIAEVAELQQVHRLHKINQEKDAFKKAYDRVSVLHEKLATVNPHDETLYGDWDKFDPKVFKRVAKLRAGLQDYLGEMKKHAELSGNTDKQELAEKLDAAAQNVLARFAHVPTAEALAKEGIQIPAKPMSFEKAQKVAELYKHMAETPKAERTTFLLHFASLGFLSASLDLSQALIRGDGGMFDVPHDDAKARFILKQAEKQAVTPQEKMRVAERIKYAPQPGWISWLHNTYKDYVVLPRQKFLGSFFGSSTASRKELADTFKRSMADFLEKADSSDRDIVFAIEQMQKLPSDVVSIPHVMEVFHHLLMRINSGTISQQVQFGLKQLNFKDFYENYKPKMDKRLELFKGLIAFVESTGTGRVNGVDVPRILQQGKDALQPVEEFHRNVANAAAKAGYQPPQKRARQEL